MSTNESNEKKGGLTDWGSVDSRRGGGNVEWLKLKSGGTYTIRLVHRPKEVLRYYYRPTGQSAICGDVKNCPIIIKGHKDENGKPLTPKKRYAIIVIDREDNRVKVMEAPAKVFGAFKDFYESNDGLDPGGDEAPDFVIRVEGSGLTTDYKVANKVKLSPFTSEERAALKAFGEQVKLSDLFKPTPPDQIEAKLFTKRENAPEGAAGGDAGQAGAKPAAKKADDSELSWT